MVDKVRKDFLRCFVFLLSSRLDGDVESQGDTGQKIRGRFSVSPSSSNRQADI